MKSISFLLFSALAVLSFFTPATEAQTVKTLLSFNGTESEGNLIFDSAGNLYGTTGDQYDPSLITVFQLSPNSDGTWTENVLWTSTGGNEPLNIRAGVIFDASGNLYGTSQYGGASNCGTVFKLTHNSDGSWTENNLHDFDCTDGNWAIAGVVFDKSGNLYGTTTFGGTYNAGVLFQLTPNSDGTWNYNILHTSLQPVSDCAARQSRAAPVGNRPGAEEARHHAGRSPPLRRPQLGLRSVDLRSVDL